MDSRIHDFADHYFNLYRDPRTTNKQVCDGFAEKCFDRGRINVNKSDILYCNL